MPSHFHLKIFVLLDPIKLKCFWLDRSEKFSWTKNPRFGPYIVFSENEGFFLGGFQDLISYGEFSEMNECRNKS